MTILKIYSGECQKLRQNFSGHVLFNGTIYYCDQEAPILRPPQLQYRPHISQAQNFSQPIHFLQKTIRPPRQQYRIVFQTDAKIVLRRTMLRLCTCQWNVGSYDLLDTYSKLCVCVCMYVCVCAGLIFLRYLPIASFNNSSLK